MRPDEHKRKKSALYKKKHGIPPKGKEETLEKPSGKKKSQNEKPKTESREHARHQQPTNSVSASFAQANEDSSSSSDSNEDDTSRSQKATFRRREIVSNWSRYEEVADDSSAPPTQRGEDFNKLLNSSCKTGGSLSQFRFRDEEDWDDGISQNGTGHMMAIDTDDLASALTCVPVHRLLSLDPMLFSTSQIKEQVEEAKINEDVYLKERATRQQITSSEHQQENLDIFSIPLDDTNIDQTNTVVSQSSLLDVSLRKVKKSCQNSDVDNGVQIKDNKNKTVTKLEEKSENSALETQKVHAKSVDKIKPNMKAEDKTESRIKSDEEDLNFLLSLDKPVYTSTVASLQNIDISNDNRADDNERTKGKSSSLPHETSEIIEMKTDLIKDSMQTKSDKGVIKGETTEDLEDWLDSILDD